MVLVKPEIVAPTYGQGWDSGYSSGLEAGWQDGHWDGLRDGRKEREEETKAGIAQAASCFWALLSKYQDRKELARRTHAETEARIAAAVKAERERIAALVEALAQKAADEELRYSRQSFGDCGRHHGVGSDALEELAAALRGAP